ncbi:hypothetical protein P4S72_06105 [Vibrio sp. PP-XX7]
MLRRDLSDELIERLESDDQLSDADKASLLQLAREALDAFSAVSTDLTDTDSASANADSTEMDRTEKDGTDKDSGEHL